MVAEDDLVVKHTWMRLSTEDPHGLAMVHIFRFENGQIAELWDLARPVPEDSPNENGMF